MNDIMTSQESNSGVQDLTMDEVMNVSGAGPKQTAAALGLAGAIGATSFGGAAWGATTVGVAFAAAPITVIALAGLAGYAGYTLLINKNGDFLSFLT
ncbi:hypothetical protein [Massilia litorea]|uniref:Bacteriocin n=1 Tax=Massilia litorea TaxID=2769491 RepID=A0A7L9U1L8_9BURK|nr:hypothetical protein [Massilia litorea]QOL47966.1 hypothetical protein LPB04_13145 [Massilia litorea]